MRRPSFQRKKTYRPPRQLSDQPCKCGCGKVTALAREDNPKTGVKKGQPQDFLPGHWKQANQVSSLQIIQDVRRVMAMVGSGDTAHDDLREEQYFQRGHGKYSRWVVYQRFNGFEALLAEVHSRYKPLKPLAMQKWGQKFAMPAYKPGRRTCLACDREFDSWDSRNRKCGACRQLLVHLEDDSEGVYELMLP